MTDELEAIRNRFAAIIPGPWRWLGNTATNQVYLATIDRGRLFILDTHPHYEEFVFAHEEMETYTVVEARDPERIRRWCGAHDDDEEDPPRVCVCLAIREFLNRPIDLYDPEDSRQHFDTPVTSLTRYVQVSTDLRFPDASIGRVGSEERNQRGGFMKSFRQDARYEVLGYRTTLQFETDEGIDHRARLYREDFCGIAQPEAEFIEHAPEDVAYLLNRVSELTTALVAARDAMVQRNPSSQLWCDALGLVVSHVGEGEVVADDTDQLEDDQLEESL